MTWKQQLKELKLKHIEKTAPGFYEASGGATMKVAPYNDNTANGLTKAICDYITFNGGSATRINTQGQMRKIKGEMKWTKSSTRKGTADIHAVIAGQHVSIEVKVGKDRVSDEQNNERDKIVNAGGVYLIASSMEQFLHWYTSRNLQTKPTELFSLNHF